MKKYVNYHDLFFVHDLALAEPFPTNQEVKCGNLYPACNLSLCEFIEKFMSKFRG